eukprot:14978768-Alexandrium_andersonii.AAC.1
MGGRACSSISSLSRTSGRARARTSQAFRFLWCHAWAPVWGMRISSATGRWSSLSRVTSRDWGRYALG